MLFFKYLLIAVGVGLVCGATGIVAYDIFIAAQLRRLLRRDSSTGGLEPGGPHARPFVPIRWGVAQRLAVLCIAPLLLGLSIVVVPDGDGGVRVSQISGTRPGTLYQGLHLVVPLVDHVALYNLREHLFTTATSEQPKRDSAQKKPETLRVQAREGLSIGLAVAVRYHLDPRRLSTIHNTLAQPIDEEIVAPVVATIFRQVAPNYSVRDIFAARREEIRQKAADAIIARLGADGIVVKEVSLRDIELPVEYARGLEGLLLKEQESERLGTETDVKEKQVRIAELEAEAQKKREIKNAEAAAAVRVLQAKAESDAMQYTLPLKEKQIEQSKLEAAARKEATLQNADAAAKAKIIDSKAEHERQGLLSDAEANRIRVTAVADSERLKLEASVLKQNPMLIQKIIAERLSDKLQIMMVPLDGKNFFANDVLRSAFSGQTRNSAGNNNDALAEAAADDGDAPALPAPVTASQRKSNRKHP